MLSQPTSGFQSALNWFPVNLSIYCVFTRICPACDKYERHTREIFYLWPSHLPTVATLCLSVWLMFALYLCICLCICVCICLCICICNCLCICVSYLWPRLLPTVASPSNLCSMFALYLCICLCICNCNCLRICICNCICVFVSLISGPAYCLLWPLSV